MNKQRILIITALFRMSGLLALPIFLPAFAHAQELGDYRTVASGGWNSIEIWERYDGSNFVPADNYPTAVDGVITIRGPHAVTLNLTITLDQVLVESEALIFIAGGNVAFATAPEAGLQVQGTWQQAGGLVNGPGEADVHEGGLFNWTGGLLNSTLTINLHAGSASSFAAFGNLPCAGIINNAGTWNMQSGNLIQSGTPSQFNNLPGAVVNLNGWDSNAASWSMNTTNEGVFNKLNGTVPFTFASATFTNMAAGTVNVAEGQLTFAATLPVQDGTFTIGAGAILGSTGNFSFSGPLIQNDGSVSSPQLIMLGSASQTLGGTGTLVHLRILSSAGVSLSGTQTVTGQLDLITGLLTLNDHDLIVTNDAPLALTGGTSSSHCITNGQGRLRRAVNGTGYRFPIGNTGNYLPLIIDLDEGPDDFFSARVQPGVSSAYASPGEAIGAAIITNVVNMTWVVDEDIPGDNSATLTLQWGSMAEAPGFQRINCGVAAYSGTQWTPGTLGTATGSNPYIRTIGGVQAFREFTVADGDVNFTPLLLDCEGVVGGAALPGTACDDGNELTVDDTWTDDCLCMGDFGTSIVQIPAQDDPHAMRIWPNPNRGDLLWVAIDALPGSPVTVTMEVYDLRGQRVAARILPLQDGTLNTVIDLNSGLTAGMYVLQFTAGEQLFTQRLLIAP